MKQTEIGSTTTTTPMTARQRESRRAAGKALRRLVPRSAHRCWEPPGDRAEVVDILAESNRGRVADLIPERHSLMLKSPFATFRGSAAVMAADLAGVPTTNIRLQSCGDCHIQNFGWFETPERNLIFDITDFDESRRAPWEWDLKRLVASVVLAARQLQTPKNVQHSMAKAVAQQYRERLIEYERLSPLEMWYQRLDEQELLKHPSYIAGRQRCQEIIRAGNEGTLHKRLSDLAEERNGVWRFRDKGSKIFHPDDPEAYFGAIEPLMEQYRQSLSDERRVLLDRYRLVDFAIKVVGIGSVGLRCGIIMMMDDDQSPLILQIKEARASVLEKFVGKSERPHHGHRVVHGQRLMQAASDLFLGWANDSSGRCFYFRQLRNMKISVELATMPTTEFEEYVRMCGWALARAHAKSGDVSPIVGYLGDSDTFDDALADFGLAYADQAETDFNSLTQAALNGRIPVADTAKS